MPNLANARELRHKRVVHCVKSVKIPSFFWAVVNLRIQSEYRKIRSRKNSVSGHFSRSGSLSKWYWCLCSVTSLSHVITIGYNRAIDSYNRAIKFIHVIFVIRRVLFLNIILNYNSIIDTNYIIYAIGFLYRWIEQIERIILVYFIRYILGYFWRNSHNFVKFLT